LVTLAEVMASETIPPIYQLHVWIRRISPMIWRRLLVRSESTLADLHDVLPIAFGWSDFHLHRFRIHGRDYGVNRVGGLGFSHDARTVRLADFQYHRNERFLYEYDFCDGWQPEVRIERGLGEESKRTYEDENRLDPAAMAQQLERLKWHLWHDNVYRALQVVEDLEWDHDSQEERSERVKKLLKAVGEFHHYIEANQPSMPNFGDRYRHGEAISTAFAESTVNQVISKRMVKKPQMRWTERGAHLLRQVRTQVLNEDLRTTFRRWYPGMKANTGQAEEVAA
jgi:hypothetical protein